MSRPARPWFRFYVEAVWDRKLRGLPPDQRWVWVAVLATARASREPGRLLKAEGCPSTVADLADAAAVPARTVKAALVAFADLGMVEEVDGVLAVCQWDARQFESDDVAARTRRHRRKEQPEDVPNVVVGTFPARSRERPQRQKTETETERGTHGGVS